MRLQEVFGVLLTLRTFVSSLMCNSPDGPGLCVAFRFIHNCPFPGSYLESLYSNNALPQCGIKGTDTRAIKIGDPSSSTEFCWQVFVFQKSTMKFLGGGSLVSANRVVTTATILKNIPDNDLIIFVGDLQQTNSNENACVQYRDVMSVAKHPRYNSKNTYDNDVAVLKLNIPAVLNGKCVCTICLPNRNSNYNGLFCTITGLGKNSQSDPDNLPSGPVYNNKLKVTHVPVIDRERCKYLIKTYANKYYVLDDSIMCAGSIEGQDACKGDGGGPLSCDRGQNVFELAGIISTGFGCYKAAIPGLYTSVPYVLDFITANL